MLSDREVYLLSWLSENGPASAFRTCAAMRRFDEGAFEIYQALQMCADLWERGLIDRERDQKALHPYFITARGRAAVKECEGQP